MTITVERFEKILALAIDPGAYDGEAVAALRRAYDLLKKNPVLVPPPPVPVQRPILPPNVSNTVKVTNITPFWIPLVFELLSKRAYELDLKSKLVCDFTQTLTGVFVTFDGSKASCAVFETYINWVVEYINSQTPRS